LNAPIAFLLLAATVATALHQDGLADNPWPIYVPSDFQHSRIGRIPPQSNPASSAIIWSTPVNISNSAGTSRVRCPSIDLDDALHVVWEDDSSGNYEIYYITKPTGGVWSTPANISNNSNASQRAVIATDTEGTLHVLWDDWNPGYWDIFYTSKTSGGTWSSPINISNNSGWSWSANLAVDSKGGLHAVWTDTTFGNWAILYASKPKGGAWSSPIVVPNNPGGSEWAAIAIDNNDTLHMVWENDASGNWEILYTNKPKGGSWSMPVNLSNSPVDSLGAAIAIDVTGTIHAAWFEYPPGKWGYAGQGDILSTVIKFH